MQEGLRVRGHGGADVAALGVHDDEGPGGAQVRHGPLQDRDAPRTEPLEERHLRLHHGHRVGHGLDARAREGLQAADVVVQAPGGQQGGVRVDADAQRTALVHDAAQACAEGVHRTHAEAFFLTSAPIASASVAYGELCRRAASPLWIARA